MKASDNNCSMGQAICLLAVVTVCFAGIHGHNLWTPDEPRVASIILEMAKTDNYIIPHLASKPFIEKPPLYFASGALMLKLFGFPAISTTFIRLTSVLFGLGVLVMTFLCAKKLWDFKTAIMSVCILGTMAGFIENFHWIRVDAALAFFVIASVWCFINIYFEERLKLLPLSGLFIAGAFLSKGLIGPVLIAISWVCIIAIKLFSKETFDWRKKGFIGYHLLAGFIFVATSGLWVLLLYVKGGDTLWNEWFWVNQVGRLTGTAVTKGHMKSGQPFYYLIQLSIYSLPWIPLVLYWLGKITVSLIKKRPVSQKDLFVYLWGVGSLVFLSIPATKRGIYLAPVFPAYAFMAAASIKALTPKWFHSFSWFWTLLCITIIAAITGLPFLGVALPTAVPVPVKAYLTHFNYYHAIAGVLLVLSLVMTFYHHQIPLKIRMVLITAVLYITLLGIPMQAIDLTKSMEADIRQTVTRLSEFKKERIAGVDLSETLLGGFYYYTDWPIPQIKDVERIQTILSGKDSQFDSLMISSPKRLLKKYNIPLTAYRILLKAEIGHDRDICLIKGLDAEVKK